MKALNVPLEVIVDGDRWFLFGASYEGPDGTFSIHFYARSMEHAAMVVEDIKSSLKLDGQICDVVQP